MQTWDVNLPGDLWPAMYPTPPLCVLICVHICACVLLWVCILGVSPSCSPSLDPHLLFLCFCFETVSLLEPGAHFFGFNSFAVLRQSLL